MVFLPLRPHGKGHSQDSNPRLRCRQHGRLAHLQSSLSPVGSSGPQASAREVLGQPSREPGQTVASAHVCVVPARLILLTTAGVRGRTDAGLFVFLGSPCLKS